MKIKPKKFSDWDKFDWYGYGEILQIVASLLLIFKGQNRWLVILGIIVLIYSYKNLQDYCVKKTKPLPMSPLKNIMISLLNFIIVCIFI
ncbi:MAG: hypothetical protein ACRCXT_04065 [Paraclostridium sp.]